MPFNSDSSWPSSNCGVVCRPYFLDQVEQFGLRGADPHAPEIHGVPGNLAGLHAPANAIAGFEHSGLLAGADQVARGDHSSKSGSHYHYVGLLGWRALLRGER